MSDEQPPSPTHPAVEGPEAPLEATRHPEEAAEQEADALRTQLSEARAETEALGIVLATLREQHDALEKEVAPLKEAAAREADLKERLLRLGADFDNFRRRARDESAQAAGRGKEALLKALLPVLDNLDRALAHTEDEGLKLLAKQLHNTLQAEGITVVSPEGEAFDAKLHEAIAQEAREGAEAGSVVAVVEKGYVLDGRVLRPARVVVAA